MDCNTEKKKTGAAPIKKKCAAMSGSERSVIATLFFSVDAVQAVSEGAVVKVFTWQCVPEHGRQPFSLMVTAASSMPFHKAMAVVGVQHCP